MNKHSILLLCVMSLAAVSAGARAQAFPAKPVTLVVPFSPGGPADIIARTVSPQVEAALGQPVVIDNRAGGNGNIGHAAVARAAPDGYTILYAAPGLVTNPAQFKAPMVNPLKELAPVAQLTSQSYLIVAHPSFKPRTLAEVIEMAKKAPVTCASGGGLPGFACDWLRSASGADITHVRYKGTQALTDVVAGHVNIMVDLFNTALPHVRSGALRPVALTRGERGQPLPDVPVVGETLPGFVLTGWHAILAPAGTPAPVVERLNGAFVKALDNPAVRKRITDGYVEVTPTSAAAFGKVLERDMERFARLVCEAGITPE